MAYLGTMPRVYLGHLSMQFSVKGAAPHWASFDAISGLPIGRIIWLFLSLISYVFHMYVMFSENKSSINSFNCLSLHFK